MRLLTIAPMKHLIDIILEIVIYMQIFYKLISCGFDIKLSIICLLSLELFISSFNCNSVLNFPFLKQIL